MIAKLKLAGIAAGMMFALLGLVTFAILVHKSPVLTLVFGFLAGMAIYEIISGQRRRRKPLFRQTSKLRPDAFLKPAGMVEVEKGKPGEPDFWFKSPRFQALMDLGLSSDQARDELVRQSHFREDF